MSDTDTGMVNGSLGDRYVHAREECTCWSKISCNYQVDGDIRSTWVSIIPSHGT